MPGHWSGICVSWLRCCERFGALAILMSQRYHQTQSQSQSLPQSHLQKELNDHAKFVLGRDKAEAKRMVTDRDAAAAWRGQHSKSGANKVKIFNCRAANEEANAEKLLQQKLLSS